MSQEPESPAEPPTGARAVPKPEEPTTWQSFKQDFKWATPFLFFALIGFWGLFYWAPPPVASGPVSPGEENLTDITDTIFASGQHGLSAAPQATGPAARETMNLLVGFEILSVLLLAALIAGVVIALRERGDEA